MKYLKLFEQFSSEPLNDLIKNARKWELDEFIEEYVYLNNISTDKVIEKINKGDVINLVRKSSGKVEPYKTIIAEKYYSDVWKFILDNTKELQDEAVKLYNLNKGNKKPKLVGETIEVYHASPNKFDIFKYGKDSVSGQLGADWGFYFFLDKKVADYYASVIKENKGKSYLYTVKVKSDNLKELNGVDVGTNWNRVSELGEAEGSGYDGVIIRMADTGYGITDELVVFDDDNIEIIDIESI